ncbi:MAG: flavodoxin family protein [Marinifilaceae bacterium]|jgi:NAD(P)H dehydrogenase (quinone)|nr:flavodoxin family protein [Marinifilaceae bacterium]
MKISIIYHSESGNTEKVAQFIAKGMISAGDVNVKCMSIDSIDLDYAQESSAFIFGSPTYMASMSWQMKKFIDTESKKLNMEGKMCGVFATANYFGGGAEIAELSMIGQLLVRGVLIYSAGASKGAPYTHVGTVAIKDGNEFEQERAELFGKRFAEKVLELF